MFCYGISFHLVYFLLFYSILLQLKTILSYTLYGIILYYRVRGEVRGGEDSCGGILYEEVRYEKVWHEVRYILRHDTR